MRFAERVALLALALAISACAPTSPRPTPATPPPVAELPPADPADADGRFAEALQYMRTGQTDAAIQAFTDLNRDFPNLSGPHTNLGIIHAKAGRNGQALTALSEAVRINPRNVVALNWLGHVQREVRQPQLAERAWLDAIGAQNDYVAAHLNLALLYDQILAEPDKAIHHYRRVYALSNEREVRVLPWIAELQTRRDRGRDAAAETAQ
jgi:tetratricopeptide (TPR) repeat protein